MKPLLCLVGFFVGLTAFVVAAVWVDDVSRGPKTDRQIYNIRRVFMHEPGVYSVMWLEDDELKVKEFWFRDRRDKSRLIADVVSGGEMWVEYRVREKRQEYDWVIIHIHSADDVSGGGWNHGKFGRGKTEVIAP